MTTTLTCPHCQKVVQVTDGPTIRQQYAMAALAGMLRAGELEITPEAYAAQAWRMADAMIEAEKA